MKKILIIDDEINIGIILSKFLTRNGFEVKTSTSGISALELMTKEEFDLVLCDF
jgi:two-component system response regulator HydG